MSRALRLADEIALIQVSQSLAEDVLKTKVSPPRGYEKTSWKARSSVPESKCESFAFAVPLLQYQLKQSQTFRRKLLHIDLVQLNWLFEIQFATQLKVYQKRKTVPFYRGG